MSHKNCQSQTSPLTRRQALWEMGGGLAGIALAQLLSQDTVSAAPARLRIPKPDFAPKAKNIIMIFLPGD
jgi:hypothetical protein